MSFASRGLGVLRLMGRRRVVVPALTFAIGLGAPSYWVYGGPAIKTAPPAELLAVVDPRVRLPAEATPKPEQNTYSALEKVGAVVGERRIEFGRLSMALGGAAPAQGAEFDRAARLIDDLSPQFREIDEALDRPYFQTVPRAGRDPLEYLTVSFSQLAKLEQYRARVCAVKHDTAGALHAMRCLYRLSEAMGNGHGPLIMYTQAFHAKTMVGNAVRAAIEDGALGDGDLVVLLAMIKPAPAKDESLVRAIQTEFAWYVLPLLSSPDHLSHFRDLVSPTDDPDEELIGNLDYRETVKEASRLAAVAVSNALGTWNQRDQSASSELTAIERSVPRRLSAEESDSRLEAFFTDTKYRIAMRLIPNSLGQRMLVSSLDLDVTEEESFLGRTILECARLQLALEIYRRRHGALPVTLEPLIAEKILPGIPIDYFSNAPLRYDRKRALIWSVSFNGQDDGGKGGFAAADGKDLVFHIPVPHTSP